MSKLNVQFIFHRGTSRKKQKLWASAYKNPENAAMRGLSVLLRHGMPGDMIEYIDRVSEAQIAVHKVHANGVLEYIKNPDYKGIFADSRPLPVTLVAVLEAEYKVPAAKTKMSAADKSEAAYEVRNRAILNALDERSEIQKHLH